jgi:hypothetical protein
LFGRIPQYMPHSADMQTSTEEVIFENILAWIRGLCVVTRHAGIATSTRP